MRETVDRTPPAPPLIPGSFINQGVYVLDRKVVELASLAESLREKWTASRVSLAEAALDLNQGSVSMAAEAEDTSRQSDVTRITLASEATGRTASRVSNASDRINGEVRMLRDGVRSFLQRLQIAAPGS
ncbi:hypothetical protein [Bradyrhizobium sp. Rc2d]|uniref:hypothetical protein n=1 Tax=Bradyrhizobium sp. Rc2d TaxID=1855321 RepID=UPI00115FAE3A|nr:hypothetical protein [Bradyrhizobium sp. Rc2d]